MTQIEEWEALARQVETNRKEAVAAMVDLGLAYVRGENGAPCDNETAIEWWERALSYGSAHAASYITNIIFGMCVGSEDFDTISEWCDFARVAFKDKTLLALSGQGSAHAPYTLGEMFNYAGDFARENGQQEEVVHDFFKQAIHFYSFAAEKAGEDVAGIIYNNWGCLLLRGDGAVKDEAGAYALFTMATKHESPEAFFNLAILEYNGTGCERSLDLAEIHCQKALKCLAIPGIPRNAKLLEALYDAVEDIEAEIAGQPSRPGFGAWAGSTFKVAVPE